MPANKPFQTVILVKAVGNPRVVSCYRNACPGCRRFKNLGTGREKRVSRAKIMKAIGDKFGWVFPRKENHVLRLLRTHARECEHEFVINCPRKAPRRIRTQFAKEELSAFQPHVAQTKIGSIG